MKIRISEHSLIIGAYLVMAISAGGVAYGLIKAMETLANWQASGWQVGL